MSLTGWCVTHWRRSWERWPNRVSGVGKDGLTGCDIHCHRRPYYFILPFSNHRNPLLRSPCHSRSCTHCETFLDRQPRRYAQIGVGASSCYAWELFTDSKWLCLYPLSRYATTSLLTKIKKCCTSYYKAIIIQHFSLGRWEEAFFSRHIFISKVLN